MKKYILNKILLAISCVFLLISCEDREIVTIENLKAPNINDLSSKNLILDSNFPDNPALTVSWDAAEYCIPTEVYYQLEISADESFSTPYSLSTLDKSIRYVTYTTKQMNTAAASVGLLPDVSSKIYFRVTGYLANNQMVTKSSVTSINITPYELPVTNSFTPLYLIGDATAAGWNNAAGNMDMYPLLPDSSNKAKYSYTGYFAAGGLKILPIKGNWDKQYGLASASGPTSGTLAKDDGGSGNIPVAAAGYYKLSIDTDALTYTFEPVAAPTTTYSSIGLIGSSTSNGWDSDTPMTKSAFDSHIWILENASLNDGEAKFRANGSWDINWGSSNAEYGTGTSGGSNIPVFKATYTVYFNDSTGDYVFLIP